MIRSREVPADWQVRLANLTGVSEHLPHLRCAWEPGLPSVTDDPQGVPGAPGFRINRVDHTVERWIIYEMIPAYQISSDLRAQLEGPPPASLITFVKRQAGVSFAHLRVPEDLAITQTQWQLYHDTGRRYFPNPFWCVQGEHGGHKLSYTMLEKKLLKHEGLPSEPPAPGELPYAEVDSRTFLQLERYLTLKQADREFRALKARDPRAYEKLKKEREVEYRKRVWQLMMDSVDPEQAREVTAILKSDKLMQGTKAVEVPTDEVDWGRALEKAEEQYVTTGRMSRNPALL
jgi:hypothetical protein